MRALGWLGMAFLHQRLKDWPIKHAAKLQPNVRLKCYENGKTFINGLQIVDKEMAGAYQNRTIPFVEAKKIGCH